MTPEQQQARMALDDLITTWLTLNEPRTKPGVAARQLRRALLGDIPLLMQAIGAEREQRERWKKRTHPNIPSVEMGQQERWVTPWKEVDDE